jgi:hypothetical protein
MKLTLEQAREAMATHHPVYRSGSSTKEYVTDVHADVALVSGDWLPLADLRWYKRPTPDTSYGAMVGLGSFLGELDRYEAAGVPAPLSVWQNLRNAAEIVIGVRTQM